MHLVEEYELALNVLQIDISERPSNNWQDDMLVLKNLRINIPNNIIISHLNINSIRNKFEMLFLPVVQCVDVLMLSGIKLDSTFPSALISNKLFFCSSQTRLNTLFHYTLRFYFLN